MSPRHEHNPQNPENARDLIAEYEASLAATVENKDHIHTAICNDYRSNTTAWLQDPYASEQQLKQIHSVVGESITKINKTTADSVDTTIGAVHPRFIATLPETDKSLWLSVQRNVQQYGVNSFEVQREFSKASDILSQQAMRAALDKYVWASVQHEVKQYGVGSFDVQRALNGASSNRVTQAMRAALDKYVWASVQYNVKQYGVGSFDVQRALNGASSNQSTHAMQRLLPIEARPQSENFGFAGSADDFMRGMFDDMARGRATPPRSPRPPQPPRAPQPPHQERSKQRQEMAEVQSIIAQVTSNDRKYTWLASEDPANILRVVNTVKKLRENAAAKQETISDKAIYIRYRRSIENEKPSKALEASFRIIDALMGGKVNGQLPF